MKKGWQQLFLVIFLCVGVASFLSADLNDFPNPGASLSGADQMMIGEGSLERFGWSIATGDFDGDGDDDILVGAPKNDEGGEDAGKVYLFLSSRDSIGVLEAVSASYTFYGSAHTEAGYSVANAGDIDGDGLDDILIGAPVQSSYDTSYLGRVYVVFGSSLPVGGGSIDLATQSSIVIESDGLGDELGSAVAGVGDVDQDGLADILLGAQDYSDRMGRAYIFLGSTLSAMSGTQLASQADVVIDGVESGDGFGISIAGVGDIDSDGASDILIGATGVDDIGAAYLFSGSFLTSSSLTASDANYIFYGQESGDPGEGGVSDTETFGNALAAGDFDGDGLQDIVIVDNQFNDFKGRTYIFFGSGLGTGGFFNAGTDADIVIESPFVETYFGDSVISLSDLDGDGKDELLIGAGGSDLASSLFTDEGQSYLFFGSQLTAGTFSSDDALRILNGEIAGDQSGHTVVSGDVNGDGLFDLVISAPFADGPTSNIGKVYIVFSRCTNYVVNPSANDGLLGWIAVGSPTTYQYLRNNYFALRYEGDFLRQDIVIPSGASTVHIEARVKTLRNTTSSIPASEGFPYLYVYVMNGPNTILRYLRTTPSTSTSWTTVQIDSTIEASAVKLRVFLKRSSRAGYTDYNRAYFDNVKVNFNCD